MEKQVGLCHVVCLMFERIRYLLLQIRNPDDGMRAQEVRCFSATLRCDAGQIEVCDLLQAVPTAQQLRRCDMVLIGGSGHYSAAKEGDWLLRALDEMRTLYELRKPTFASCWGFQAFARALGGEVHNDLPHAELGSHGAFLTDAGLEDPIFSFLGPQFIALMGHEDRVVQLPRGAVLLASSQRVTNQAYCFPDRPIYATQFHPELDRESFRERIWAYPEYIERITGQSFEEFDAALRQPDKTGELLPRFVKHVLF